MMRAALAALATILLALPLLAAAAPPADATGETDVVVRRKTVNQMIAETLSSSGSGLTTSSTDPQVELMERVLAAWLQRGPTAKASRATRDVADIEQGPKRRDKRNLLQILSEALLLRPQYASEYLPGYVDEY